MKNLRGDFAANHRLLVLALMALPIGVASVVIARGLLLLMALFTNLFYFHQVSFITRAPALTYGYWTVLVPVAGGLIIGLMAKFGSEKIRGHGIPEALEAILFGKSIMQPRVAVLKPLSSAISIGSGGPFGAEGPIIMTGGALGSIFSQLFNLSSVERKTLLVAGAVAGMTAVFGTPMAAVLLAIELLLFEWRPRSLVPVALACGVASALRPFIIGGADPLFAIPAIARVGTAEVLAAVPVGIAVGLLAWLISSALYKIEDGFVKLPIHWAWWPAIGGAIVGLGGLVEPRVLGVGYDVITEFLQGHTSAQSAMILTTIKCFVWIIALASGTSGGVLAPLLIMGAGVGVIAGPYLPGQLHLWPLVTMAAIMGGMMRSPFTATIFALELTDEIHAMPVLLLASVSAYACTVLLMKRSILTEKIARRGYDIFREYAVDPLERLTAEQVMTTNIETISISESAIAAIKIFEANPKKHRGYPVVDQNGYLAGILTASDVLNRQGIETTDTVADLISERTLVLATAHQSCSWIAERMASENIGRMPIVHPGDLRKIVGIVTRSDLLKARLHHLNEENFRERALAWGKK